MSELASYLVLWVSVQLSSTCIVLKVVFVVFVLLLQKSSCTSKPKDHSSHLERHLLLWHEGNNY